MVVDKCTICDTKRSMNTSLHRIPKNPTVRAKWIEFFKFNENTDAISRLYICSNHFTQNDYVEPRAKELGHLLRLKPDAIPSVLLPAKKCYLCNSEETKNIVLHRIPKNRSLRAKWIEVCELNENTGVSKVRICNNHFTPNDYLEPRAKELGHLMLKSDAIPSILVPVKNISLEPIQDDPQTLAISPQAIEIKQEPDVLSQSDLVVPETPEISEVSSSKAELQTVKRRTIFEPRYVGDIRGTHLSSPKKAKRCLDLAKRKIANLSAIIKVLKQENRRLVRKSCDLKGLVNQLKRKK